jgi:hypothetical protein
VCSAAVLQCVASRDMVLEVRPVGLTNRVDDDDRRLSTWLGPFPSQPQHTKLRTGLSLSGKHAFRYRDADLDSRVMHIQLVLLVTGICGV